MQRRLLLDVVVCKSATVLKLLTGKDQPLLVRGNSFLVLNLSLHIVDRVRAFHLQSDGLAGQSLDKDLHTSPQTKHQMESGLLLDVVVRKSTAIFELLTREDQPLLVRGNSFLVLNLSLHVINGVGTFHLQSNRLTREGLHEDLHTSPETKHQVKSRLLLDVVVCKSSAVLELLTSKDQPLLVGRNALLVLNFGFDVINGIGAFYF
ncbi:hypothetical protein Mapa_001657 [Marchantia paleacea]|nr:hypothetical protein Mapa_001657 [Marchantia paleacea]